MSAHTPGPWTWTANPHGGARVHADSAGIADVLSRAGVAHPVQACCEANARLIAAAPEMLAALKACLDYIPGSEVRNWPPGFRLKDRALELARAAIARAEGSR